VKGVAQAPNISPADINTMFSTNVTGLIAMTQAILPIFQSRPNGGSGDIINIGSIAGREPYQGGSIYCATKAAVRSFTDAMRKELIATRIRIIEIDPGQVETEFSVVRFGGDKEKAKKVYEGVEPLTPEDIAEVVVFAAGRRENVVLADTLVFPNHQVRCERIEEWRFLMIHESGIELTVYRRRRRLCIGRRRGSDCKEVRNCRCWMRRGTYNMPSISIILGSFTKQFCRFGSIQ
jgi:short-subunit dehydrogenase involved in D-alanine esterification of teichoic acids